MSFAIMTFDTSTSIATVTLNRPEVLNAIDVQMAQEILAAVCAIPAEARCIVLAGAGRAFAAGGDLAGFARDFDRAGEVVEALLGPLHAALLRLRQHSAPVLCSVHGAAAGAGLSLVAASDLAISTEDARFVLAFDRIGSTPDTGGTWFLPRKIGVAKANELMLLSEPLNAQEALQLGLVNRVVARDQLAAETAKLAAHLASGPTQAYASWKRLSERALIEPLAAQLDLEKAAFVSATKTADFREGVSAFMGKRAAQFAGR